MGPFPSAAPGPASMFAGPGPGAGGSYWTGVLGRRARPRLVEFPTGLVPPAGRMRSAFPLGVPGRRALRHSTSGVGAAWAWSSLSAAAPAPADPELGARARPPLPRGPPAPLARGARRTEGAEERLARPPGPPHAPRASAPPTCNVFSAAITACSGSRAGPGPPPPGGRLSPQHRAAAAAARARAERDAPPCRPPARTAGGPHARAAALRRPGALLPAAALLARSFACSPACPPRAAAATACRVPPLRSLDFLRRHWSGAWQTSTCCWRTPRTETGNPKPVGGNPGGVGRGEGSCWNLSGSTEPPPRPCIPLPAQP